MKSLRSGQLWPIPFYILLLTVVSPILVEILMRALIGIKGFEPFIISAIYNLKLIFPNKEIFWIAYTGIVTALSLFGAYLLPIHREKELEETKAKSLIDAMAGEIYANWAAFSGQTLEIRASRAIYDELLKNLGLIRDFLLDETILRLSHLYQKMLVYEFLWQKFYDKNYEFGRQEVMDNIKMRKLALNTFEQRYQSVLEFLLFLKILRQEEMKKLLKKGLVESNYQGAIDSVVKNYGSMVSINYIKDVLTNRTQL